MSRAMSRASARMLRAAALSSILCASSLFARAAIAGDEPERRAPEATAPALKPFAWTSKNGLRFIWWLPKGYDAKSPRNMTVILHGTGLDYRWGLWNNKPGIFRPEDVVVSVDGPTPDGSSRLFLGEKKDADAVDGFLTEMRASFVLDRVFLYGHSQGGFFTVYFAGEHPDHVAGVVAHASGAWNWSKTTKDVHKVAIAFLHGSADPVVPYAQSPDSRDAYAKAGFPLLHMRRLPGYNHWPNAVRATEELDWCQGMTAKSAEDALAMALDILRVKAPDEYRYETPVGFSAARAVLRRIEAKGPAPFANVDEKTLARAKEWIEKIEAAGALQVDALKHDAKKKDVKLEDAPWIGHVVALREDFRGVDSVEAFLREIEFDKQVEAQEKPARAALDAWYKPKSPPKTVFTAIVDNVPKAYFHDGFPPDLAAKMKEWKDGAAKLGIAPDALKKYADFESWIKDREEGAKRYEAIWKKWKGP
jgi:predicted esterase